MAPSWRSRAFILAASLIYCLNCASAAAQSTPAAEKPPPNTAYRELIEAAVLEYQKDGFAEARAMFARAHEMAPSARTWMGLGMTEFELRNYAAARTDLQNALRSTDLPLTPEQRERVERLLGRTESYVADYLVTLQPQDATLRVDGVTRLLESGNVLTLEVGEHTLSAHHPGYFDSLWVVDVEAGRKSPETLELRLNPVDPLADTSLGDASANADVAAPHAVAPRLAEPVRAPRRRRTARVLLAVSATTAALAVGLGAGTWRRARRSEPGDADDRRRTLNMAAAADVAGGITIASGVAAGLVWWLPGSRDRSQTLR